MTSIRTSNRDRRHVHSRAVRDCSARLNLKSSSSVRDALDGAWWPRSRDPVIELVALSEAVGAWRVPVRRIALNMPGWDSAPRRIRLASGRRVAVDWFRTSGVPLVLIVGTDDQLIDLLIIPVDTTPATAHLALANVEVDEITDIENGPAAEDLADVEVEAEKITVAAEEAFGGLGAEDIVWDEEESQALRQARKDAELSTSADSVRAYLKQIGKVALLKAEQEVELAKRIEAGLYAAERVHRSEDATEKLFPQLRRDLRWIVRDGERAKNHLLEANLRLVVSLAKRYTGRG
ncbi:MAG: DUF5994 family protein, partial [Pseudonocardiaceae bacterium]